MQQEETIKILKAAEGGCFDAMFGIQKVACRQNTSVVVVAVGILIETQLLTDEKLNACLA